MSKSQLCEFTQEQKRIPNINSRMCFWNKPIFGHRSIPGGYKDIESKDYRTATSFLFFSTADTTHY